MKSAYELAVARLGRTKTYTAEQKEQLAEIDRVYEAKIAEAKLAAEDRLRKTAKPEDRDKIGEELARRIAAFEKEREARKDGVRQQVR
jgi:hypothetical protein